MDTGNSDKYYILWFVAAALALLAAGITYFVNREVNAMSLILALFGLAMGYMGWSKSRATAKPGPQD